MEFAPTRGARGKLLSYGCYEYVNKQQDSVTYWRCECKESCRPKAEAGNPSHDDAGRNVSLKTVHNTKERDKPSEG